MSVGAERHVVDSPKAAACKHAGGVRALGRPDAHRQVGRGAGDRPSGATATPKTAVRVSRRMRTARPSGAHTARACRRRRSRSRLRDRRRPSGPRASLPGMYERDPLPSAATAGTVVSSPPLTPPAVGAEGDGVDDALVAAEDACAIRPASGQTRTVPSAPALATEAPSGLMATPRTSPSWPRAPPRGRASRVPETHGPVSPRARDRVPSGDRDVPHEARVVPHAARMVGRVGRLAQDLLRLRGRLHVVAAR